jgi:hypothetical protein
LSFWDTQADAERGIEAAAPTVRTMLAGLVAARPVFYFGEVVYAAPPEA